ncbi:MAG TPA: DUF421 domain-containing protein [Methylomusa anaerophila]|uniref:DUF421 domain-containing protein n=1 Tax=Methylomusa anaerophila TaxID=1930071 RepID=A0A348ALC8_9FIRM|nr:DUF421 domain-containing protein [Methylomusa anaerophila]BBB91876.1 hypothetical protein MAMMFC1_02561 [Methylomusa anaerophila]HML88393.1 DUF421 domain-containing protein [Methylomusa anaerophila]
MDWQEIMRDTWQTSLVFLSLLVFTRVMGKTQIGQLTLYEYISGITIGSIAGTVVSSEPGKVWSHYYDLILFVALAYFTSFLTIKSRPLRKIIEGSPTIVIKNGNVLIDNMRGMRFDLDELNSKLREKGILDHAEVQYAIVEPTGDLNIIKKSDYQPLTKTDVNIHLPDPAYPVELIMDGQVIEENLRKHNLSRDWLEKQLTAQGIFDIAQVSYAGMDSKGQFTVSKDTAKTQDN